MELELGLELELELELPALSFGLLPPLSVLGLELGPEPELGPELLLA